MYPQDALDLRLLAVAGVLSSIAAPWGTPPPDDPACDPSYPDVCIPSTPPDLDCAHVPHVGFRVVGADPHGFDLDDDGIGCEPYRRRGR